MSKSKKQKSVKVTLEKAEEDLSAKTHVAPEIIESIMSRDQREQADAKIRAEIEKDIVAKQLKNRLLFYGGVGACVTALFLLFRFFKVKPQDKFVPELINGAAQLAGRV